MNQAQIVGRLVRDPELRFTGSGKALCFMTLASDRRYKNQEGEREADFIPVKTWGNVAKTVAEHLKQGRRVAVTGSMRTRLVNKQEVTYNEVVLNADSVEFLDAPNRKAVQSEEDAPDSEFTEHGAAAEQADSAERAQEVATS